jgi:intracellular multiplication protein IcmC
MYKKLNITLDIVVVLVFIAMPFVAVYAQSPTSQFIDFNKIMSNFTRNAPKLIAFAVAISYTVGVWFCYASLQELRVLGQMRTMMPMNFMAAGPAMRFFIGLALLYLPTTVSIFMYTVWGHGYGPEYSSVIEYPAPPGDIFAPVKQGTIAVVRLVGYFSFIRGFIMLSRATRQQAQPGIIGKSMAYIFGGILAINIWETIIIIENTFGFAVQ